MSILSDYALEEIGMSFGLYISGIADEDMPGSEKGFTLMSCIEAWLVKGGGMSMVGGDYTTYLQAVIVIMDAYEKTPSMLDTIGVPNPSSPRVSRRVKELVRLGHSSARSLDPYWFRQAAMDYARCRH